MRHFRRLLIVLHKPVLLNSFIEHLSETPAGIHRFLDTTFGRGGHTEMVLKTYPEAELIGVDCDEEAIKYGRQVFQSEKHRVHFLASNFAQNDYLAEKFKEILKGKKFSAILMDLGVSSPQLDTPERGFSFYEDGPLDMRMDLSQNFCAKDIINNWNKQELMDLFFHLGEVRRPGRVVEKILDHRKRSEFQNTMELSNLIAQVDGWRKKGQHPATKYFLALRIEVNGELEVVKKSIPWMVQWLEEGGRIFVITFHSTEDRLVKQIFKELKSQGVGSLVNKKVIQANFEDKKRNPRSRSAKMRIFQKGEVVRND